jgi:hypothetical protein
MLVLSGYGKTYGGGGAGVGALLAAGAAGRERFSRMVQRRQLELQRESLELQETALMLQQQNADRAHVLALRDRDFSERSFAENLRLNQLRHEQGVHEFEEGLARTDRRFTFTERQAGIENERADKTLAFNLQREKRLQGEFGDRGRREWNDLAERSAKGGETFPYRLPDGTTVTLAKPESYSATETAEMKDIRGSLAGMRREAEQIQRDQERITAERQKIQPIQGRIPHFQQQAAAQLDQQLADLAVQRRQLETRVWQAEVRLGIIRSKGKGDSQLLAAILDAPGLGEAKKALASRKLSGQYGDAYKQALLAMKSTDPERRYKGVLGLLKLLQLTER